MKIQHNLNESEILSRIIWKTNLVRNPYLHNSRLRTHSDSKRFIGKVNERGRSFAIKRNRVLYLIWLPQLFFSGSITKNQIIVKVRPGLLTSLFYFSFLFWVIQTVRYSIFLDDQLQIDNLIELSIGILFVVGITIYEYDKVRTLFHQTIEIE